MFARIVADLGVHNNEIVFIDDQGRHLEAAERIGIKTVQFMSTDQAIREINEVLVG